MALVERAEITTPAGPFLYFGFGSSLDVERLHAHCPSARLVGPARLADHRLGFTIESKRTWLGGVADIVPSPGDEVWGALWLINAAESHPLDDHEGVFRDPPAYERVTVEVTTLAGDRVRCRSYRVAEPDPAGFLPSPMFRDAIVRGARAVGLPDAYVARLAALPDNGRDGGVTH